MKSEPSVISPDLFHSYMASVNRVSPGQLKIPPRLVMTFHHGMFDAVRGRIRARTVPWYYDGRLAVGASKGVELAVLHSFMGSPASSLMLEEMIASGARLVIEVGTCGGLVPALRPGDLIVASEGLPDEGTSGHYFEGRRRYLASETLSAGLMASLRRQRLPFRTGAMWTTDAPYRETLSKLKRFVSQGAVGVNMETSALFAIAEYRGVRAGSIQVVSDIVGREGWKPAFHARKVESRSRAAALSAVEALAGQHEEPDRTRVHNH